MERSQMASGGTNLVCPCTSDWINVSHFPPFGFIAVIVEFTMMAGADGNGKLVGGLASHGTTLGKVQVLGLGRRVTTILKCVLLSKRDKANSIAMPERYLARLRNFAGASLKSVAVYPVKFPGSEADDFQKRTLCRWVKHVA